jgi:hypothetical protein
VATFTILDNLDNYFTVRIQFGDQTFDQRLTSVKTGAALTEQFQAYADLYEADWNAMQPPEEPVEE